MIYNELQMYSDRSNDRSATRYPSPPSPMDSLITTCPTFDMSHSPSLQDSPALPAYRIQFGPELSTLLDESERSSSSLGSSVGEVYHPASMHDPTASFSLSFLQSDVFPEDVYTTTFGPMLVPPPSSELSWTSRSLTTQENNASSSNGLCLSPYAINLNASYRMSSREESNEYTGISSFETIPGESTSSSDTDSSPRTPETITPSIAFGNFTSFLGQSTTPKRGSTWEQTPSSSATSSFLEDERHDPTWKMNLGRKSKLQRELIRPTDRQQILSGHRPPVPRRRRMPNTRAALERPALLDGAFGTVSCEFQVQDTRKSEVRCDVCNKRFQRSEHLTRHKKSGSHTPDMPFECELPRCLDKKTGMRKCFNRQDNKTAHIVKTHLTPAAKGRRDRVTEEEARELGWEKHFAAAAKEQAKQEAALSRQSRTHNSNGGRVTKKPFRKQQKASR